MTSLQIYIDGMLADVSRSTVVAWTIQAWNVGDMRTRNVSFTRKIKLPDTPNNRKIFDHAQNTKARTTKPYASLPAKVIQNGIQTIRGIVLLDEFDETFMIAIYSSVLELFEVIGDKTINELDFSDLNAAYPGYDNVFADSTRGNTTGIVSPVHSNGVNIGHNGANYTVNPIGNNYQLLPSVYYHTIIDKILTQAGFQYDGDVFDLPKFQNLIVSAGNSSNPVTYSDRFYGKRSFHARVDGTQVINLPGIAPGVKILFPEVIYNGEAGYYDAANSKYNRSGVDHDNFKMKFTVQVDITVSGGTVKLAMYIDDGAIELTTTAVTAAGTGLYTLEATIDAYINAEFCVRISTWGGNPVINVVSGIFKGDAVPASETVTEGASDTALRLYNEVLPPITQKDFLQDFMLRFGRIAIADKQNVIQFKSIDAIIANRKDAYDWSSKRVSKKDKVSYDADVAQLNLFRYEKITDGTDDYTGYGLFAIDNRHLSKEDEFTSPFGSSEQTTFNNASGVNPQYDVIMAELRVWDTLGEFDYTNDPGGRLLLVRDATSNEPDVLYVALVRADYKIAYFEDGRYGSCSWQSFLDEYWPRYISLLQSGIKNVSREYLLTERDIADLDLSRMVYDDGEYFLIKQIKDFIPGRPTTVDLFKTS